MANSILKETNNFLENFQNNNSFFRLKALENYDSEGTIVTGAAQAILPMRISTIGKSFTKDGRKVDQRISFTLLINPDSWNQSKTQASQANYTRQGWVVQLWGPNQDTISSTGKTAAMMTNPTGLDNLNAEMSFAYLNFLSLVAAYRSNGYIFEDFTATNDLTRCIKMVYGVEIEYDNQILLGHFNNFTLDEDSEHPFVFNYNFEFIVSSLSPSSQIRGHYQALPTYETDLSTGTGADPDTLILTSDPYSKRAPAPATSSFSPPPSPGAQAPAAPAVAPAIIPTPPHPSAQRATEKLWGSRTGLSFEEAIKLGLTDNSEDGNFQLRRLMMGTTWDKDKKAFKNKDGFYWTPNATHGPFANIDNFIRG